MAAGPDAIGAFIRALTEADRRQARICIARTPWEDNGPRLKILEACLAHPDAEVRRAGIVGLGPGHSPVDWDTRREKVAPLLEDHDKKVRLEAVGPLDDHEEPLLKIGKTGVPALAEALAADDVVLRVRLCCILRRIGRDASDALPVIRKLLDDEDDEVRREASLAIAKISGAR